MCTQIDKKFGGTVSFWEVADQYFGGEMNDATMAWFDNHRHECADCKSRFKFRWRLELTPVSVWEAAIMGAIERENRTALGTHVETAPSH